MLPLGSTFCARKETLADLSHTGDRLDIVVGDVFCVGHEPVTNTFKALLVIFERRGLVQSERAVGTHSVGSGSGYLTR